MMPKMLDHMAGALYRVGLHHEDGTASLVSLSAHPIRTAVGEVSASAADAIVHRRNGQRDDRMRESDRSGRFYPDGDIGPSTI